MSHCLVAIVLVSTSVRSGSVKSRAWRELATTCFGHVAQAPERNETEHAQGKSHTDQNSLVGDKSSRPNSVYDSDVFEAYLYVGVNKLVDTRATHWGMIVQHVQTRDTWTFEVFGQGPLNTVHMAVRGNSGLIAMSEHAPDQLRSDTEHIVARSPGDYDGIFDISQYMRKKFLVNIDDIEDYVKRFVKRTPSYDPGNGLLRPWRFVADMMMRRQFGESSPNLAGANCQWFVLELYKHIAEFTNDGQPDGALQVPPILDLTMDDEVPFLSGPTPRDLLASFGINDDATSWNGTEAAMASALVHRPWTMDNEERNCPCFRWKDETDSFELRSSIAEQEGESRQEAHHIQLFKKDVGTLFRYVST